MIKAIEIEGLPKILIKGVPKGFESFSELGKAMAMANPVVKIASGFGQVADKLYMSSELCLINLARRTASCKAAAARNKWFGGRVFNRFSGAQADYVELSGAVVAGTLEYIGDDVPDALERGADYLLRRDLAEDLLHRFKTKARAAGMIL